MKTPEKITVTVYNHDLSVRSRKCFEKNGNPDSGNDYGTDYYEAVAAGADDIQDGSSFKMEVIASDE